MVTYYINTKKKGSSLTNQPSKEYENVILAL